MYKGNEMHPGAYSAGSIGRQPGITRSVRTESCSVGVREILNRRSVLKSLLLMASSLLLSVNAVAQSCPTECGIGSFMGAYTPSSSITGGSNVFIGNYAGSNTTHGANNSFLGWQAGKNNISGSNNSFFGHNAGQANSTGSDNVFVGTDAGNNNTTGGANVFMGPSAGTNNTDGEYNVYIGRNAARSNMSGDKNVYLGYSAGYGNLGDRSVFIGSEAGALETNSQMLYIANSAHSALIKGDFASKWLRISDRLAVGIDNPTEAFEVNGNGKAYQWLTFSDERLKEDIQSLSGAMSTVNRLSGISYRMKDTDSSHPDRTIGLSAQAVKQVIPELVHSDAEGLLAISYDGLIPVLIEALKEKDQEIQAMKQAIYDINAELAKSKDMQLSQN
ncbi:tail fiber domain-containing protein [Bacterioplanes sanyensis]|nr:tail fiber domain-containing protein [Bacterioplanes sanyensis]